jgi:anti-sigma regulatory factor (Ser/Thr protein kinase)
MLFASATRPNFRSTNVPSRLPTRPNSTPHFFSLERGEDIETILMRPYSNFVEISTRDKIESLLPSYSGVLADVALSITTFTCYQNNVAICFADMLSKKFDLGEEKKADIKTCLQEAVMNSILHGNLGVGGKLNTVSDFEIHQKKFKHRLTLEEYKNKRIHIHAWDEHKHLKIAVSDEGNGFDLDNVLSKNEQTPPETPHGRGIMFIKSLADELWLGSDGGAQTLYMTFGCR